MALKILTSKKEVLFLNCITLLIFNVIFLLCNVYPKHILEFENVSSIFATLLNLVFYFFYFMFLNMAFNNTHFLSKDFGFDFLPFTKRIYLSKTLKLLIVQIIIDITKLLVCYIAKSYSFFVIDIITMMGWLSIYFIIVKKEFNVFIKRKAAILISITLLFIIMLIFDFILVQEYFKLISKYQYDSIILQNGIKNCDFIFAIKNFIFDSLIGIIIIFFHYFYNEIQNYDNGYSNGITFKFLVKVFLLFVILIIACTFKTICLPYSSIKEFSVSSDSENSYVDDAKFYANTEIFSIERVGVNRVSEIDFTTTKDTILYNGDVIKEFYSNDSRKARTIEKNGNQIIISNIFDERVILETKVQIYKNQMFCFIQDDIPQAIHFSEINNCSENKIILEMCKKLISEGNIGIFEYCDLYLCKYDSEFITPYINRYMYCDFTDDEIKSLNDYKIKKEYIVDIAKNLKEGL